MSGASLEWLAAVIDQVETASFTAPMTAGKVFGEVPQGTKPPYVVVHGPQADNFDAQGMDGEALTVQLTVWSDYRGDLECLRIAKEIYDVLHDATLSVTGQNPVQILFGSSPGPFIDETDERLRQQPIFYNVLTFHA